MPYKNGEYYDDGRSSTWDNIRDGAVQHGEKKFICGPSSSGTLSWGCQKRFAREDSLTTHFFKSGWNSFRPLVEEDDLWILFDQEILSGERKDNDFNCNLTSLGCRREFDNLVDLKEHFLSDEGRKCVIDWAEKKFLRPSRSLRPKDEDSMRISDEAPQSSSPCRSSSPIRRLSSSPLSPSWSPRSPNYSPSSPLLSLVSEPAAPISRSPSPRRSSSRVLLFSRSPRRSRSPSPRPLQRQLPLIPEQEVPGEIRNNTSRALDNDNHFGNAHSAQRRSISNPSPMFHSPYIPRIPDSSLYSEWKLVNRSHECGGSPGDVFSVRISCPPLRRKDVVFSFDDHCTYDPHIRVVSKWRPRFRLYELSTVIPRLEDNVDHEIVVGIHLSSYLRGNSDGFVVGKMFYKGKRRSTSPSPLYDRSKRRRKPRQRPGKKARMRWEDPHELVRP